MCKGGCLGKCGCNMTSTTKGEKGDESSVAALGYKVYVALLTQGGTVAPTVTVLQNTMGVVPVWSYGAVGSYNITSASLFTASKTVVFLGQYPSILIGSVIQSTSTITISSEDLSGGTPTAGNGLLSDSSIEIRVYP